MKSKYKFFLFPFFCFIEVYLFNSGINLICLEKPYLFEAFSRFLLYLLGLGLRFAPPET